MEKMMKKLMFALIAALFCSSLMAQVLIYDYAASFKRIDVKTPVKVSYRAQNWPRAEIFGLDSPKVASDKFTGYMVIDACDDCGGLMEESGEGGVQWPGNPAVVYIKRNSNKKAVYRAIGRFQAGMFGAKAGFDHSSGITVNPEKFTDAFGFLSYNIYANGNVVSVMSANKAKVDGFMGLGHVDMVSTYLDGSNWWEDRLERFDDDDPETGGLPEHWYWLNGAGLLGAVGQAPWLQLDYDTVDHAGFGKVKLIGAELDCFLQSDDYCYVITSLAGSMLGGFVYTGYCSDFLVDICEMDTPVYMAPIAGTFTLKLNNRMTFQSKMYKCDTFKQAEEDIEAAFGSSVTLYADPIETLEANLWLTKRNQEGLADYYFWYSRAAKRAVIDNPKKNEYPALTAALGGLSADVSKVTKVTQNSTQIVIEYEDASGSPQTATITIKY